MFRKGLHQPTSISRAKYKSITLKVRLQRKGEREQLKEYLSYWKVRVMSFSWGVKRWVFDILIHLSWKCRIEKHACFSERKRIFFLYFHLQFTKIHNGPVFVTQKPVMSVWSGFIRTCCVALVHSGGSKDSNSHILSILLRKNSPMVYFELCCSQNLKLRLATSSTISSCSEDQKNELE